MKMANSSGEVSFGVAVCTMVARLTAKTPQSAGSRRKMARRAKSRAAGFYTAPGPHEGKRDEKSAPGEFLRVRAGPVRSVAARSSGTAPNARPLPCCTLRICWMFESGRIALAG